VIVIMQENRSFDPYLLSDFDFSQARRPPLIQSPNPSSTP
jgi:phospholipase C